MSIDERVASAVEKTGAIVAAVASVAAVWVIWNYPLFWLVPLAVGAVAVYYVALLVVGFSIGWKQSSEDFVTNAAKKDLDPPQESPISGLVLAKGPLFGSYMEHEIYEWIDVQVRGQSKRFVFSHGAQVGHNGSFVLPQEEGFAFLDGSIYVGQPEFSVQEQSPAV